MRYSMTVRSEMRIFPQLWNDQKSCKRPKKNLHLLRVTLCDCCTHVCVCIYMFVVKSTSYLSSSNLASEYDHM